VGLDCLNAPKRDTDYFRVPRVVEK
jgi:hypothetical protein